MTSDRKADDRTGGERPMEMPAVRTTIVGGRPPGCGKPLGDIPRGIEVLVKQASVDAAFRALLLAQRAKAADEIGLILAPEEETLLNHVPAAQLEAIIARTKVDPSRRSAFLSKAAGVMLAALGASAVVSEADIALSKGIRVDPNATPATQPTTQPTTRPTTEPLSRGVRPDMPATQPAPQPLNRPANIPSPPGGARPDVPPVSLGIRADLPAPAPSGPGAAPNMMMFEAAGAEAPAEDLAAAPAPVAPAPVAPRQFQGGRMRVAGIVVGPVQDPPAPASRPAADGNAPPASPENLLPVAGVRAPPRPMPNPDELSKPAKTQPVSQPTTQLALTPAEIAALVKQLDDDQFPVRDAAHQKLQGQGLAILPALREALQDQKLSAEVRSRLQSIVTKLEATTRPVVRPDEIRVVKGLQALPVQQMQIQPQPAPAALQANVAPAHMTLPTLRNLHAFAKRLSSLGPSLTASARMPQNEHLLTVFSLMAPHSGTVGTSETKAAQAFTLTYSPGWTCVYRVRP